jgi:hypothetical protein
MAVCLPGTKTPWVQSPKAARLFRERAELFYTKQILNFNAVQ